MAQDRCRGGGPIPAWRTVAVIELAGPHRPATVDAGRLGLGVAVPVGSRVGRGWSPASRHPRLPEAPG